MKGFIKIKLRENLLEQSNKFIKADIDIPDYKELMLGNYDKLPGKYSDYKAEVKYMTSKEYLNEVAKMQGTSYDEQLNILYPPNVKKIMNNMQNGVTYNMGYLNYIDKTQEGRHRMFAANKLGAEKSPVLIISKSDSEDESDGLNKTFNIKTNKGYSELTNLFDEDISSIIDFYLYDEMIDGKLNVDPNETSYYISEFYFETLSNELIKLVKDNVMKLDKNELLEYYDEEEIDFNDVDFIFNALGNLQHRLKGLFNYVNLMMSGVSDYLKNKYNLIELDNLNGDLRIDFNGPEVKVMSDLNKEDIRYYDFDFKYVHNIKKFNPEVVNKWMGKYPYK
tara:strand:+ start:24428 stop:25435 length:1008 start_codon:yes stop_codon:yes gene_type:complete